MPRRKTPNALIATQKTTALLLGKSARWLRDQNAPRTDDGKYDLIELVQWDRERVIEQAIEDAETGSDSDWLETGRMWKAKRAELDFKRESGEYKHIDQVREALAVIVGPIGNCIQTIQKQFGDDAVEIIQEALDQADAMFNRVIEAD